MINLQDTSNYISYLFDKAGIFFSPYFVLFQDFYYLSILITTFCATAVVSQVSPS